MLSFNTINATQSHVLQTGDFLQIEVTHQTTGTGQACIVNEFPLNGVDTDASKGVFQTGSILLLKKTKTLISDPVNGTTNPKSIPGAVVRYQIEVSNDAIASAAGDNVALSDIIPANTNYIPDSITLNATTLTDATGDDAGEYTGTTVSVNAGTTNPNASSIITYDVTVE